MFCGILTWNLIQFFYLESHFGRKVLFYIQAQKLQTTNHLGHFFESKCQYYVKTFN